MSITLDVAPGVRMTVELPAAERLHEQLRKALAKAGANGAGSQILDDDHPLWDRHSGGTGHDDPPWTAKDGALAEAFYVGLKGKAKVFFDILLDHPGRQLTADEMIVASRGELTSSASVAGAINGLRLPREAAGRRYPFTWWEGTPSSRYAVKSSVAALFNAARATVAG